MDKTLEHAWDEMTENFFRKKKIDFELLSWYKYFLKLHAENEIRIVNLQLNFPTSFSEGKLSLNYEENGLQKDILLCRYLERGCHKNMKVVYTTDNEFQIK